MKPIRVGDIVYVTALLLCSSVVNAQVSDLFFANLNYPSAGQPAVASGDFNGDGNLDLAQAGSGNVNTGFQISVSLGNGDGSFQAPVFYASGGRFPIAIIATDVNGDGITDLLVLNREDFVIGGAEGNIGVLLGNGNGTFQPVVSFPTGNLTELAYAFAVADINGDGKKDIVVANSCGILRCDQGSFSIVLGNGDGTFQAPQSYLSGGYRAEGVVIADFNGDGKPDLAILNDSDLGSIGGVSSPASIAIFLGDGNGTFVAGPHYATGGYRDSAYSAQALIAEDFNLDGKIDLAVANVCYVNPQVTCAGNVGVLLGNGDGSFQNVVTYPTAASETLSVVAADVNGDGKLDLLLTDEGFSSAVNGGLTVLLGNGDGSFQTPTFYPGGELPLSLAVGDYNHDGITDVVTSGGSITVFLGNGDGTFPNPSIFSTNPPVQSGQAVASADLNRDGKPDVVILNQCVSGSGCAAGEINVLLNSGNGVLGAPAFYSSGAVFETALAIGDLNGDGFPDIVIASSDVSNGNSLPNGDCSAGGLVSVLLGNGDGTFQTTVLYASGGYGVCSTINAQTVALGDFNGDGKPDIAVANQCGSDFFNCSSGNVSILLGNGDGTFQPPQSYDSGFNTQSIVAADFNGDGKLDLVATNTCFSATDCSQGGLSVLLGNGDGSFMPAVSYPTGGGPFPNAQSIVSADFNGDGKLDVIVTNRCFPNSDCTQGSVSVLLGNGDGTFQSPSFYQTGGPNASSIVVSDFNGDGKLDLAIGNAADTGILLGNGDGTFAPAVDYAAGNAASSIAVADFNGDGTPDLAVPDQAGDVLLIFNRRKAGNTPVGSNIAVSPRDVTSGTTPVTLTFSSVTQAGNTTLSTASSGPNPPSGFSLGSPATYYNLSTSAAFNGGIQICINYSGVSFSDPSQLHLFHFENGAWTDVTISLNQATTTICGSVTSLSPFAIFQQNPISTMTSLTSSAGPSLLGASVTFDAVVTPSQGNRTPSGTVTFSDGGTVLGSVVLASGQASFVTSQLAVGEHSISARYSGDSKFLTSNGNLTQNVEYGICALYDQTKSVKSGATFPIKIQLCDASDSDVSSSAIVALVDNVTSVSGYSGDPESPGNSNPDNDFRFDSTLGSTGGYVFNFKTTGLATGTYSLQFKVTGDVVIHSVNFGVK